MNTLTRGLQSLESFTETQERRSGDTVFWRRREQQSGLTYSSAVKVLDRVREGANYPLSIVTKALQLTGDIYDTE